jgi:hypothetical protein
MKPSLCFLFWALGIATMILVEKSQEPAANLPPNTAMARENSGAITNLYLVAFTVQTEGGGFITGDISFASDLKTLRDLDALRVYVADHLTNYHPAPIARPTILNIVKL